MQNTAPALIFENNTLYAPMHIQLDTLGGIAGDMFIAAVLDARPELTDEMFAAIRATGIPPAWEMSIADHCDDVFRGMRFTIRQPVNDGHAEHQRLRDIVRLLRKAPLNPKVCDRAVAIFEVLAKAEADVHGVEPDDVTFHEVGAWDSIGDIVGAAYLIETLDIVSWSVRSIPLGGGRITTAHGPMPVPAPATAKLLEGFALIDDGVDGERVTPTGAAILHYLQLEFGLPLSISSMPMTLKCSGTGFGTRVLPGISNVLRVLVFDRVATARIDDQVGVIQFELDDQTAEDLALGLDSLRTHEGALDVLQMPAVGKKGRMIFHVQILCRQDALDDMIDACFVQTTTLGLRWSVTSRAILSRRMMVIESGERSIAVKLAERPNGKLSAKSDAEDVRDVGGYGERRQMRRTAERLALQEDTLGKTCKSE